jgi:hypothetical protein
MRYGTYSEKAPILQPIPRPVCGVPQARSSGGRIATRHPHTECHESAAPQAHLAASNLGSGEESALGRPPNG